MKRNYVYFLFTCLLTFVVSGCDTDIEPEVIQAANTYNEEYYQNLRVVYLLLVSDSVSFSF